MEGRSQSRSMTQSSLFCRAPPSHQRIDVEKDILSAKLPGQLIVELVSACGGSAVVSPVTDKNL